MNESNLKHFCVWPRTLYLCELPVSWKKLRLRDKQNIVFHDERRSGCQWSAIFFSLR